MTKKQALILVVLACSVFCVLCLGGYVIISEESAYKALQSPTQTRRPTRTPTPKPTKPPWSEEGAEIACQEFVKRRLNFPSIVKWDWAPNTLDMGGGKYFVPGMVWVENVFGVEVQIPYDCTVHYDSGNWKLDDLVMPE